MSAPTAERILTPAEAAYKHSQVLSRALHTGHAVLYQGKREFIQVLTQRESGGGVDTELYLKGKPELISGKDVALAPDYE